MHYVLIVYWFISRAWFPPVHWSVGCQVGEANVHTALSLVGYEEDLRRAMEYVFGSTLVCDTLDNAKKVAFDERVKTKTVTLGGDIFDPQGTLSGGERGRFEGRAGGRCLGAVKTHATDFVFIVDSFSHLIFPPTHWSLKCHSIKANSHHRYWRPKGIMLFAFLSDRLPSLSKGLLLIDRLTKSF